MITNNEKARGILFLSILDKKLNIKECIKKSQLTADEISNIISIPKFQQYFKKKTKNELIVSCRTDWIVEDIAKHIKINQSEHQILEEIIKEKLMDHIAEYWKENGKTDREESYLQGNKDGSWVYYDDNGNRLKLEKYQKGKNTGAKIYYYDNGKKEREEFHIKE